MGVSYTTGSRNKEFLSFSTWGDVNVASPGNIGDMGHTPPPSLAALTGGGSGGMKYMYALSVEPYLIPMSVALNFTAKTASTPPHSPTKLNVPLPNVESKVKGNLHNIRQKITCWKITVAGSKKNSVDCVRYSLSENILQRAIARSMLISQNT